MIHLNLIFVLLKHVLKVENIYEWDWKFESFSWCSLLVMPFGCCIFGLYVNWIVEIMFYIRAKSINKSELWCSPLPSLLTPLSIYNILQFCEMKHIVCLMVKFFLQPTWKHLPKSVSKKFPDIFNRETT